MLDAVGDMLIFAAVARAGSLTRAGQALALPKSTISRRLAALEERLGSRLVVRSTRKLLLTEAGEAFLERCQRVADDVDDALTFANELSDEPRGTLRITMVPDLGPLVLAEAIARFSERYPRLSIELDESGRYVDLDAERFDVALRAGVLTDSSLVARRFVSLASGVFASPAYLATVPLPRSPDDLAQLRFVVLGGRTRFDRITLHDGEHSATVSLASALAVNTSGMQRALALAGAGAMVYPLRMAEDAVAKGQLVRVLPSFRTDPTPIWLVTPTRRLLPRKTMLLIDHLLAEAATTCRE